MSAAPHKVTRPGPRQSRERDVAERRPPASPRITRNPQTMRIREEGGEKNLDAANEMWNFHRCLGATNND
ncbi:unnamed protein product [Lampetra fluviatilis]